VSYFELRVQWADNNIHRKIFHSKGGHQTMEWTGTDPASVLVKACTQAARRLAAKEAADKEQGKLSVFC